MKKVFLIAVCVAACGLLFAQTPHVQFGLKAGVNIASLNEENGVDLNSRAAFHVGGLAHIHVSRHFAVQPEIYYSGQGGKDEDEEIKLGYLNMPVLLQYMTGNGLRLQTGPQVGILLSAKDEDEVDNITFDIKDQLKSVDFSWSFGASYQIPNSGLGLDARYNLGITNIRESGGNVLQNRVASIGLFYQFTNHARRR
jgi:hypothetical protein